MAPFLSRKPPVQSHGPPGAGHLNQHCAAPDGPDEPGHDDWGESSTAMTVGVASELSEQHQ